MHDQVWRLQASLFMKVLSINKYQIEIELIWTWLRPWKLHGVRTKRQAITEGCLDF